LISLVKSAGKRPWHEFVLCCRRL